MEAIRVTLGATTAYWTVVDEDYQRVAVADRYLYHLRFGADRSEGTTRSYAGDLALFFDWASRTDRSLEKALQDLAGFVTWIRMTPVERPGRGRGQPRGANRINHITAVVRELAKHAVADGTCDSDVLRYLYEVGDNRNLPAELRGERAGLMYRAKPRHRIRRTDPAPPNPVTQEEVEALLSATTSWRQRFIVVLLWFCGLRIGEMLGLRRSDLHFADSSISLGCLVEGPHLHVVRRDNENGAFVKGANRTVPVRLEILHCYDSYLAERSSIRQAAACDFVFVNLFHAPLGAPMRYGATAQELAGLAVRAGITRRITPHMFRHATATELRRRGTHLDVIQRFLGHKSPLSTQIYEHVDQSELRAAVDALGPIAGVEGRSR
jgi:site-specific recombinase XerD